MNRPSTVDRADIAPIICVDHVFLPLSLPMSGGVVRYVFSFHPTEIRNHWFEVRWNGQPYARMNQRNRLIHS